MGTPDPLKVHVFSEQRHLSQTQDHETNIIVEFGPHRALYEAIQMTLLIVDAYRFGVSRRGSGLRPTQIIDFEI